MSNVIANIFLSDCGAPKRSHWARENFPCSPYFSTRLGISTPFIFQLGARSVERGGQSNRRTDVRAKPVVRL